MPFGLVFEEIVTNAFRHAFTKDKEGVVVLRLRREARGEILLEITDNGAGLSPGFDPRVVIIVMCSGIFLKKRLSGSGSVIYQR
ncbi:MAG: ATP-binding protein [Spirochaetaceae bacterium]